MKNCKTYKYYVPFVLFLCLCGVFLVQLLDKGEKLNSINISAPSIKINVLVSDINVHDDNSLNETTSAITTTNTTKATNTTKTQNKSDGNPQEILNGDLVLDNKTIKDFKESLEGEVSILHFFATWCGPCRDEHGDLLKISQKSAIPLYGVAYKDETDTLQQFLEQEQNPYRRVYLDESGTLGIDMGIYGTPTTFLIDKKGHARYRYTGKIHEDDFEKRFGRAIVELQNEH